MEERAGLCRNRALVWEGRESQALGLGTASEGPTGVPWRGRNSADQQIVKG